MVTRRVALFGGQDLGYVMADYFSRRDDVELFVVSYQSQHDIINGYRTALTMCRERDVRFIETSRPYQDAHAALAEFKPDILLGAYYARLFPPELIKLARMGAINVHPGKFPRYRGPMPTPWYILNGETTFGMGIFQIDAGIDTGPVFIQKEYPIPDQITGHELLRLTQKAAGELYIEAFDRIMDGELVAVPQHGVPYFCPRIETALQDRLGECLRDHRSPRPRPRQAVFPGLHVHLQSPADRQSRVLRRRHGDAEYAPWPDHRRHRRGPDIGRLRRRAADP